MKIVCLLTLGVWLFTLSGCNYFRSTHPQAEVGTEASTGISEKSVLAYSGTIDRNISNFKKEYSLVYMSGDLSMYVEKYSQYNNGMLYKVFTANGTTSTTVKSYYFKNDSLILVKDQSKVLNAEGEVYKDMRTYMRNNVTFKIDSRTAGSAAALVTLPYLVVQPAENNYPQEDYTDNLKSMNDAILGSDKFAMIFENITTYPEAYYINLKSTHSNNYKASILVTRKDSFIDSLLTYPSIFKDQALHLKWKINNTEAVYLPKDE